MNELSKTCQEVIDHYGRMEAWVLTRPEDDPVDCIKMYSEINEDWHGGYCSFCKKCCVKNVMCEICNLNADNGCCGGLWKMMHFFSETWGKWLAYGRQVKAYIIEHGKNG